ncbi:MAG: patatin-like protein [Alphaproteobacteria bacterium]|nr:patatin-like protein [Alphaproteobacteria bacterium]
MREKELRLALVCYGGVSLAVYMHGVSKEILKLARASTDHQAGTEAGERASNSDYTDTEAVYLDLLRQIGQQLELHIVVDVIAGASAGGINGILLARALALDLAFDPLRSMWLDNADVSKLLAPDRRASMWSKWILRPVLRWGFSQRKIARLAPDQEMRDKLSLFIRSRWFRPPFGGLALSDSLYNAMAAMGSAGRARASLTPSGQWLDLFVTLTDFFGYDQHIPLHDPSLITEREHRHTLHFRHRHFTGEHMSSDFDSPDLPALVFAARATSSFPGAFPPARISEIDRLLARRQARWPGREKFLRGNFSAYDMAGQNPEEAAFIDGSVLNNKPFAQAIESIKQRPAHRQVDRRLVYIDPDPEQAGGGRSRRAPSMLRTLKGALSDIPRNEPIRDELDWIRGFNIRVGRLKTVLDSAMPQIDRLVAEVVGDSGSETPIAGNIAVWRARAGELAAERSGYAYEGYLRLRIEAVIEQLAGILATVPSAAQAQSAKETWAARLRDWATTAKVYPDSESGDEAAQSAFLRGLDADYRARRLRFVVRGLNEMYGYLGTDEAAASLDLIKGRIYDLLEDLRRCRDAGVMSRRCREMAMAIAAGREDNIAALIGLLADDFGLSGVGQRVDQVLDQASEADLPEQARRGLLNSFLGFAFWDVLAFTVTSWRDVGEFDEIRVDRISPDDADSLHSGGGEEILKGVGLGHFAAFFSRRHRENDYLWGRLHGAERLIDIVVSSAKLEGAAKSLNVRALKKRAFTAILEAEAMHLGKSGDLLAELRQEIAAL